MNNNPQQRADSPLGTQEALILERERFAVTLKSIGDGVIATDTEGRVVLLNEVAEQLTGWTQEQAAGKPLAEIFRIINEKTRKPAEDPVAKALATGRAVGLANHTGLIAKDGTERSIADSCAPIRNEDGQILGAVLVFRDVTEERRAEEALRVSEERFRSVTQTARDAIICADMEGRIIVWNQSAQRIFGYPASEVIGKPLTFIMPERFRRLHEEGLRRLVTTGLSKVLNQTVEVVGLRQDGEEFPVELSLAQWDSGAGTFVTGILRDVSELKKAKDLSEALNRISEIVHSTLNLDEVIDRVLEESARAIEAEAAGITLREGEHWIPKHVFGLPQELLGLRFTDDESKVAALVAETRKPVIIQDTADDARVDKKVHERHRIRSTLGAPLIVRKKVTGVIFFNYHSAPVGFSKAQIDFAGQLATTLSLALENARLYEAERTVADMLQEALLAKPRRIKGLDVGCLYHSATVGRKIGGDFYDIFEIDGSNIGIVVGDISGKGLEAATLSSLVRNTIRAYAFEEKSPATVLAKADRAIHRTFSPYSFATVFYGVLNTKNGSLAYCSAGHPRAVIKQWQGGISLLKTSSPVLGAASGLKYVDEESELGKGDTLLVYTDGVTEARYQQQFFGEEKLLGCLEEIDGSPEKLPHLVFDEVLSHTGGKLSDDIVLLAISPKMH